MKRLGIAVIGFGWMGQAHSRSYRRIPMLFPDRVAEPDLVACADPDPSRGPPTSFTTTEAPSLAKSRAVDRPMPFPAPVTIATLPSNSPIVCTFDNTV